MGPLKAHERALVALQAEAPTGHIEMAPPRSYREGPSGGLVRLAATARTRTTTRARRAARTGGRTGPRRRRAARRPRRRRPTARAARRPRRRRPAARRARCRRPTRGDARPGRRPRRRRTSRSPRGGASTGGRGRSRLRHRRTRPHRRAVGHRLCPGAARTRPHRMAGRRRGGGVARSPRPRRPSAGGPADATGLRAIAACRVDGASSLWPTRGPSRGLLRPHRARALRTSRGSGSRLTTGDDAPLTRLARAWT